MQIQHLHVPPIAELLCKKNQLYFLETEQQLYNIPFFHVLYSRVESFLEEVISATSEDKRNMSAELVAALCSKIEKDWSCTIIKRIEQDSTIWKLYINDFVTKLLASISSAEPLKIRVVELWAKTALQMEQRIADLHVLCHVEKKSWSKFVCSAHSSLHQIQSSLRCIETTHHRYRCFLTKLLHADL